MNARFLQSSARTPDRAALAACQGAAPGLIDHACCFVARAVVRVVIPPTPGRRHETELLLCGHHYRISRQALSVGSAMRVRTGERDREAL